MPRFILEVTQHRRHQGPGFILEVTQHRRHQGPGFILEVTQHRRHQGPGFILEVTQHMYRRHQGPGFILEVTQHRRHQGPGVHTGSDPTQEAPRAWVHTGSDPTQEAPRAWVHTGSDPTQEAPRAWVEGYLIMKDQYPHTCQTNRRHSPVSSFARDDLFWDVQRNVCKGSENTVTHSAPFRATAHDYSNYKMSTNMENSYHI